MPFMVTMQYITFELYQRVPLRRRGWQLYNALKMSLIGPVQHSQIIFKFSLKFQQNFIIHETWFLSVSHFQYDFNQHVSCWCSTRKLPTEVHHEYCNLFHMGNRWHICVREQIIKSVYQIRQRKIFRG